MFMIVDVYSTGLYGPPSPWSADLFSLVDEFEFSCEWLPHDGSSARKETLNPWAYLGHDGQKK
jgi:hypothetical protein